jgi:hypothetical protein
VRGSRQREALVVSQENISFVMRSGKAITSTLDYGKLVTRGFSVVEVDPLLL